MVQTRDLLKLKKNRTVLWSVTWLFTALFRKERLIFECVDLYLTVEKQRPRLWGVSRPLFTYKVSYDGQSFILFFYLLNVPLWKKDKWLFIKEKKRREGCQVAGRLMVPRSHRATPLAFPDILIRIPRLARSPPAVASNAMLIFLSGREVVIRRRALFVNRRRSRP